MIKFFTKRLNNKKGFTLIELIVVIAILGILAALAIPRFVGTQATARQRAHNANEATLRSAAALYLAENGNPATDQTWSAANDYIEQWPIPPSGYTGTYSVKITTEGVISIEGVTVPSP